MTRTRYGMAALILGLALLAGACSALTPDNPAGTLQAQRQSVIAEASSIAQAAQVQGTQVMSTAVAAQTYVAQMEGRNQQLMATLQIVFPPTQALVENNGTSTPGQMATPAPPGSFGSTPAAGGATPAPGATQGASGSNASIGSAQFTQVGTASSVRASDDCADVLTDKFPASVQKIYITTRALNVSKGIEMRAEWYFEGQLTYTETYTVPRDDTDFCMWLSITPTDVKLSTGNWSVKLFANNQATTPPEVNFTVG